MTDSNEWALYIANLKEELITAEKKAKFYKSQYEQYREETPDVASCHKLQMRFEEDKMRLLKEQIRKAEDLRKRLSALKAKINR